MTYTPRMVCVELKGSLNTLRQEGTLYDFGKEDEVNWYLDIVMCSEDEVNWYLDIV